jgi:hypothetical protein
MHSSLSIALFLASFVHGAALAGFRNHWSDPYSLRPNPLYPYARSPATRSPKNISTSASRLSQNLDISPSRTWRSKFWAGALQLRQEASGTTEQDLDTRPTPEPTGEPSVETTVFITDENDFALLLPAMSGGMFEFVLVTGAGPRSNPLLSQSWYPTQKWTRRLFVLLRVLAISARKGCLTVSSLPPRSRAQMTIRGSRYLSQTSLGGLPGI